MKNTMLWGALFTLICAQVQADVTQQATQPQMPNAAPTTLPNDKALQTPPVNPAAPATQPIQQVQPAQAQPTQNPADKSQQNQSTTKPQTTQQLPSIPAEVPQVVNCDYKIPAETKKIEQSLVMSWSEKAAVQAFNFDPTSLDTQLQKLQSCFTEQGWTGFNSALQKSGNLDAIKTQKLTVSSQVDGQSQVTEAKDNQWKITLPLQVVYQNDKEKVTQLLNVNLTVGRKITGDLGIVQIIASPREIATEKNSQPSSVNPSTNTVPQTTSPTTNDTPPNTGTTPTPTVNPAEQQKPSTGTSNPTN